MMINEAKRVLAFLLSYAIVLAQTAPLEAQSRNVPPDSATSTTEAPASTTPNTGDENNAAVAGSVQTEAPLTLFGTTTKVTTSGSPSFVGQSVTFTATVTSTHGAIPDGETMTFYDGTTAIGTGTTAAGVATFTTSSLVAKKHVIKATYAGDTKFATSSGTVTQVVNKYATTTKLVSSSNPTDFGQAVKYTATVSSAGPNTPTGSVNFGIGTAVLSGGVATLTKTLAPGTHAITAKYLGDSVSAPSASSLLNEVVEAALFAEPGGPYSGNTSQTITFNGTGSDAPKGQTITSYAWNFGDSGTGTGATPTHVYANAGTFTVSLTVKDTKGLTATNSTTATITAAGPPPTITGFSPGSGPEGTPVGVSGTNFAGTGSATPVVTLAHQGGGSVAAPVSNFTATSINFVIPSGAATGDITVTVGTQSATSTTALTVTTSSSYTVGVAPASGSVIQGQSTTFSVTLNSSNGFTGLSALSVTGLPGGVTASFNPASISVGQTSIMTLSAPMSQAMGTSSLNVTASATISGQLVSQSATVSLQVNGISTTFLGRTVVDDPTQTPIGGVLVTFLGVDDKGNKTGCSGAAEQTSSDASGNFVLTNLPAACVGPQLIAYNGLTATSPAGKFAGVNLSYTIVANQVTTSPVLIHLPRIDNAEINYITQNANVDQVFTFQTDPRIVVTVYAGTTFTLDDGSMPNPFPLVAVEVPVDRLPDNMPTNGMVMPFIVAFQPANATASQPVAVDFPNLLNIGPGGAATLMTLDPTHGYMVSYGTGSISADSSRIVPDIDPANSPHRYGLVHFDWHGPIGPPPPPNGPGPCPTCCSGGGGGDGGGDGGGGPEGGDPVDLSSGLQVVRATDMVLSGGRGSIPINRVFRSMDTNAGPFGIGTNNNYSHLLNVANFFRGTCKCITLVMPDGNQFLYTQTGTSTFTNATVPSLIGSQITIPSSGVYNLRWKDGRVYQFTSIGGPLLAYLTSIADRNGNTTTLVRGNTSQPSQITQIMDPVGRALTLTYDPSNRITQISDPISRTVQYTYNSQGTLATVTNAAGGVTTYSYDTSNNLLKINDPRGLVVMQNTYDNNGRVIQQVQADGGVLNFAYTLLNSQVPTSPVLQTVVTDALGNSTTYRFDPTQNLLNVTDPTGQVRVFTHSLQQNNLVTSITGGGTCPVCGTPSNGDVTFTYDSNGNVLTRTDSLGGTTTYTYDPVFGQITSITDPLGNVSKYTYDASGNKISKTDPDGNTTSYVYNSFGQVVQTTDGLGKASTSSYDSFGNLSAGTDPLGNTLHFSYDAASRLTQTVDGLGRATTITYDQLDRQLTRTNPKGNAVSYIYDAVGNRLSVTDETGNKTTFTFDGMSRPLTRTDPRGKTETGTYDFNGNLVKFVDRLGQASTFSYDALNHLISESYNDGSTAKRSYDARGRILEVVDSAGGTFDFAYDADGRRTSSSTQFGTTQYTYDAAGGVISTQVVGQPATTYTYDPARNLLTASQPGASASFTYDARNYLTNITRPNGVATQYTYDAATDLLSIGHSGGQGINIPLTYGYDPGIFRTTYSTSFAQPTAVANTFDSDNRLTKSGGTTYTYDDNGALTSTTDSTGTTTYGWDSRHRLTSLTTPSGQKTTFLYDYLGNLMQQTDAGPSLNLTQSFVLDDLTNVAYIGRSNGDSVSVLATRSVDHDVAVTHSGGQVEYALTDAINSTVATVDQTGKAISSFSYEPFGKTTTTSTYPFQYTGRLPVTAGLYNYRARYYSCNGRFISEDPLGFGGGTTLLYEYAANNPFGNTDPSGTVVQIPGLNCEETCKVYTAIAAGICTAAGFGAGAITAGVGVAVGIICGVTYVPAIDIRCNRNCKDPAPSCPAK